MRSLLATGVLVVVLACGKTGGGGGIPPAIAAMAKDRDAEARAFTGWQVPGVTLYSIVVTADDLSETSVVGVDDRTGAVVQGGDLLRRMGPLAPDVLAERVGTVLLGGEGEPLSPKDSQPGLVTAAEWAAVTAPAVDGRTLVFFGMRGEMRPVLTEYRVDVETYEVKMRAAIEALVDRGQTVAVGEAFCEPLQQCGCWSGCARFQPVRVPGRPVDQAVWHRTDTDPPETYVRGAACSGVECAQWCAADAPTARCQPPLRADPKPPCEETCRGYEAPYHCDTYADRCEQVLHPKRGAAAAP